MKTGNRSRSTTLLGLLTAILLILSMTPLGYLNIGPLAISFNMIPVAVGAAALGPAGGTVLGAVFGITCIIEATNGSSAIGAITMTISPVLTVVHRLVPRVLTGFVLGVAYRCLRKHMNVKNAGYILGFLAAFLNTVLFLGLLVLLFKDTQFLSARVEEAGGSVLMYLASIAGVNALVEMIVSPVVVGTLLNSLERAGVFKR